MGDQIDGSEPSCSSKMESAPHEWEYNAPQFVDFNSPNALDLNDEADAWFDQQANAEDNFYSLPSNLTPVSKENVDSEDNENCDKSVYYDTDPTVDGQEVEDELTPPKKRLRRTTRNSTASVSSITSTVSAPPSKHNLVNSWGHSVRKLHPSSMAVPRRSKRRSLQVVRERLHPKSGPQRVKRPMSKSSEELELERIAALKKQAQQTMKQSQRSLSTVQSSTRKRPHTEIQPTRTHEFHFQTDHRIKNHGMKTRQDETLKPGDFAKCLRTNKALSASAKPSKGPTVPQPFHLTKTQVKPRRQDPGYTFHSDAEKIIRFQEDTPERFRTRAKNDQGPPPADKPHQFKLTMPHTPNLVARNRKRPITVVSAAEMEEQEVEDIKRFKFRAQPVNTKIFERETGIPKVEPKESTKIVGFNLQTEKRPLVPRHPEEDEEEFQFKAQPVPKNILEGTVGIKKAEPAALTVPASPAFALKNRIRSVVPLDVTDAEEIDRIVRANPVPHHGVAFQPKIDHRTTVPAPFSFAERDRQKMKEKEEKIQKVIEEETKPHEFHAQPVPDYDTLHDHIPKTKVKPVTKQEPFNLESVQRSHIRMEEIERQRQEEFREERAAMQFKARPATVTTKEPFVPRRPDKPLTEINEFELNTERRAHEREAYEERKHEKDVMLEQMNKERQVRQEEEEKREIRDLRHALVHKAQPIKHFRPVSIHPSDKILTEPQSPNFSERNKK